MEILVLMLPLMLVIATAMLGGLVWAIRSGQFDDLEDEKYRIFDDAELAAVMASSQGHALPER
jgi:cbb3-type cytochrome oxidase maturation protein